jgi:DNA recombination protein RmuC
MALELVFLVALIAMILGGLLSGLFLQLRLRKTHLPLEQVKEGYILKELYTKLERDADLHYENLQEKLVAENQLNAELSATRKDLEYLREKLQGQREEMARLQQASLAQFEQTANRLLQEKSQHFTAQNATQIGNLLTPLRERIEGFEKQVERRFLEETRDRVSLRQEIKHLQQLNVQISAEANNLAGALRGSSKTQGDWGEWQLLTLLEASGLQEGIHFTSQGSFRDEDGRQKRPDFIVNLPEKKHLIIDAKVSLTAYERYCALPDADPGRQLALKEHLRSIRQHILDLAGKNYTRLYQINSPDYLLLFIPIEPAFGLALNQDKNLFLEALERNVVLVTASTLLATLRTVNYIWKQENQKRNVLEIARQSGLLYDKFVAFTEDLQKVGQQLDRAQLVYGEAMDKLHTGAKKGATLVGRAERLRTLGARTRKQLPKYLLEEE